MTLGSALPIPTRLEDVTAEWLSQALPGSSTHHAPEDLRVTFERIGQGVGLMGELARFRIDGSAADETQPERVIVKLPGADPGNRASGQMLGLYEREVRFYLELAGEVPVRTPRCFHAAFEPDPGARDDVAELERSFARLPIWAMRALVRLGEWLAKRNPLGAVLVLEDLEELRAGDQLEGGSNADWAAAIDALAQLHAAGWEREAWLGRDWVARMRPNVKFNHALFSRQYSRLPKAWADRLGHDGRRLGDWLAGHGIELMETLTTAPDTLCHADYRLDNLFFDDDRGEVVVFDWQLPARSPGVLDLAYFLSGVMGPEVEAVAEEGWVRRYHDGLVGAGVAGYDWARCRADYHRARLATWQRCIASASAVEPGDARGTAMLEAWWDRMHGRLGGVDPDAVLAGAVAPS